MKAPLNRTWHLAEQDDEAKVTEFEFALWRVMYGFLRWQEKCQLTVCHNELSGYDIALLHIIRMKDRAKTISEISNLLNRDDQVNIQYGIKKLIKLGLVKKSTSTDDKRQTIYKATTKGIANTDAFRDAKREILVSLCNEFIDDRKLEDATKILISIKNVYEEAARVVYTL